MEPVRQWHTTLGALVVCTEHSASGFDLLESVRTLRVVGQMPRRAAASLRPTPNWPCRSASCRRLPGLPGLPVPLVRPFAPAHQPAGVLTLL